MFRKATIAFAGLLVVGLTSASAQDRSLDPSYGTFKLQSGSDPLVLDLLAGGPVNVFDAIGGGCGGHVAEAPDLVINFTASANSALTIAATSNVDTTLIVAGPDGDWICDDDSGGDFDPRVVIDSPVSGDYAIWVGTYNEGRYEEATLSVATAEASADTLNWDLDPQFGGTELVAGFLPDPFWVDIMAGGPVDMSSVGSQCWGYAGTEPDYRLFFEPGDAPLTVYAMSEADTTIAIADPDGNWFCNDDTNGLNPQITFDAPLDGQYDIWVGTYGDIGEQAATLFITELGGPADTDGPGIPDMTTNVVDPALPPTFGAVALESGFLPDPFTVELSAGGDFFAYDIDPSCVGYIGEAPNFRLTYTPGIFPLYIWARANADATLVILDPNGNWICDDDGAAYPLDPAVAFDDPVAGDYLIWVGTYGGTDTAATLYISEVTDGRVEADNAAEPPVSGVDDPASGVSEDPASGEEADPDEPSGMSGVSGDEPDSAPPVSLPDDPVFME